MEKPPPWKAVTPRGADGANFPKLFYDGKDRSYLVCGPLKWRWGFKGGSSNVPRRAGRHNNDSLAD